MTTLSTPPAAGPSSPQPAPKRKGSHAPNTLAAQKSRKRKRHNTTMFAALDLPTSELLGQELLAAIAAETDLPIERVEESEPVLRGLYTIDIQNDDERRRYHLYPNSMISTLSVTPLAGKAEDPRWEFDFRSSLLRLHKSRGYPMEFSARTFWG